MSADDAELEKIKLRKLAKMLEKKEVEEGQKPEEPTSDDAILSKHLFDRADEVLKAAETQYPKETKQIESALARMFKSGQLAGMISGGELLALFRSLGLHVTLDTQIRIVEHGKAVSLQDKLKESLG